MLARSFVLALAGVAVACSDVEVVSPDPALATISGSVLLAPQAGPSCGTATAAQGPVYLFLFDADDPPPPAGTGRPLGFVLVPGRALFPAGASVPDGGIRRADFIFPNVATGRYLISGFLDADGDFNPSVSELAQPTAGDLAGGYVDGRGRPLVVEVSGAESIEQVPVQIGRPVALERPMFRVRSQPLSVPSAVPTTLILDASDLGLGRPECTAFEVRYRSVDAATGRPRDLDGDGLPDLFPRVVLSRPGDVAGERILAEGVVDPLPFLDALAGPTASTSTTVLRVLLPPVSALSRPGAPPELQVGLPPGDYELTLVSGSGQTWTVPTSSVARLLRLPEDQYEGLTLSPLGTAPPRGRVLGQVEVPASLQDATVWVVAFAASSLPPPRGTGSPVGLARLGPRAGTTRPFELGGLLDGAYVLSAFADADGNFSPFVTLLAEPSSGDHVSPASEPVQVSGAGSGGPVSLRIGEAPLSFGRPFFRIVGETRFDVRMLPSRLRIEAVTVAELDGAEARFPVTRAEPAFDDGFAPRDVWPRAALVELEASGGRREGGAVVPVWTDALPFLGNLANEDSLVVSPQLDLLILPVALRAGPMGLRPSGAPPDADYQLVVFSPTGQTWAQPSGLERALGRPLTESPVRLFGNGQRPSGAATGQVQLAVTPSRPNFVVVVAAFLASDPPPPLGAGRPRGQVLLTETDFQGGLEAVFRIEGLAPGRYILSAFLDTNESFAPWVAPLAQPDAGDVVGGAAAPIEVGTGAVEARVLIPPAGEVDANPPAFRLEGASVSAASGGMLTLVSLDAVTAIATVQGAFMVRWVDLDQSGVADDVDGDGAQDVFPLVRAVPLDEMGQPAGAAVLGRVDPAQFAGLGFPAGDPTQVREVRVAPRLQVSFRGGQLAPGAYALAVVAASGQVWTIPNVLATVSGTELATTQGAVLTVGP